MQAYLRFLLKSQRSSVIAVGSISSDFLNPGSSSNVLTKITLTWFNEFVSLENPNVRVVVYHPRTVLTPILDDLLHIKPFALETHGLFSLHGFEDIEICICTAELAGAFTVHLTTEHAEYLNGRYASVNWNIEELEARNRALHCNRIIRFIRYCYMGTHIVPMWI